MNFTGYTYKHLANALGVYLAELRDASEVTSSLVLLDTSEENLRQNFLVNDALQQVDDLTRVLATKLTDDMGRAIGREFPLLVGAVADIHQPIAKQVRETNGRLNG